MIRFDSDDLPFGFDASDEALDQTDPTLEELEDDASWDDDDDDSDFEHPDDAEEPDDDGWN